jgi:hypothetical protein
MNGIEVLNWRRFESGSMCGRFDLAVSGLVVTGCKAFRKPGDNGEDRLWFAWPAEKTQDKEGTDRWREIVTAAEPVMRHLQRLVRPQLRALLDGNTGDDKRVQAAAAAMGGRVRQTAGQRHQDGEPGNRAYQESRRAAAAADDIPF